MSTSPYHLFQCFGIELEYMIVDKDSLQVKPIADELLKYELGEIGSDFENGIVTWSNELVLHVIEIKSSKPEVDLETLEKEFEKNISRINAILSKWNAMLLPSAAHPLMNPFKDTKLWPHDNNEVYALYDKIFNSKGHGWSNLQSTHLNLPFYGDEEFAKLHAACRLILPLLPALCASSPLLDGKRSEMLDTRLHYYKTNQTNIPIITGRIIPENIYSHDEYKDQVYLPIAEAIAPYDPETILDPIWVNSRGAMARFDRGSIEIRVMDIQECAAADMAIVYTVIEILKLFVNEELISLSEQKQVDTEVLASIFDQAAATGFTTQVKDLSYLNAFGMKTPTSIKELWITLLEKIPASTPYQKVNREVINTIISEGSLSERIIRVLGADVSEKGIKRVYHQLSVCLKENKLFIPNHV